jgi:hypothetical protein
MPREGGASSNHRPQFLTPGVTGSSAFADDDDLVLDRERAPKKVTVAMSDLAALEQTILSEIVAALGKKGSISMYRRSTI